MLHVQAQRPMEQSICMDEVAFVESLFSPELRSAPANSTRKPLPSPRGAKSVASRCLVPLNVGPEEEYVTRHFLMESDLHDTLQASEENGGDDPNSCLFEPLDLPTSFRDVFLNLSESPVVSPMARPSIQRKRPTPCKIRPSMTLHDTPRHANSFASIMPLTSTTNINSVLGPLNNSIQLGTPIAPAVTDMLSATSSIFLSNMGTPQNTMKVISTAQLNGLDDSSMPILISTSMLTPTANLMSTPIELDRTISSTKGNSSKASKASHKSSAASIASSSALHASLATPTASASSISSNLNNKGLKGKKCIETACERRAQSNSRCKAHGGGARCQYAGPGGCTRSSQGGGFCRAHGGGKRCEYPGCSRGQQRKGRCYVHGGIRKCQIEECEKKDRGNGFCISHGGGKRCQYPGCARSLRRGTLCQIHDNKN